MFKNIPGHFGYTQLNNCKWLISFGQFKGLVRRGRKRLTLHRYPSKVEVLLHIHHGFIQHYVPQDWLTWPWRLAGDCLNLSSLAVAPPLCKFEFYAIVLSRRQCPRADHRPVKQGWKAELKQILSISVHVTSGVSKHQYLGTCPIAKQMKESVCMLSHFSRVWLFVTPWTVACQAPLSMRLSRQEYWSGVPLLLMILILILNILMDSSQYTLKLRDLIIPVLYTSIH